MSRSAYTDRIRHEVAALGRIGAEPRHVEAWMRLEHSTLDGLSAAQFRTEVKMALACMDEAGRDISEDTARSFGF